MSYENMRPVEGEDRYVDFDTEFQCWAMFGSESGFCYGQYSDKLDADEALRFHKGW